ncbi:MULTISPECIES: DEAD/DEAH box helicase [unclassified Ensifer]|uniref:DEAD/DEAH box helicase n=1 Tax=unclassified Ensifer TaxID=2633371 RepID=UPI0008132C7D|nr:MULTISPECIES: DEAD/DEAH box helicase [unclassified Ensifer]OCO98295.1 ATP-dependent RNA helicase [Ensifer sp. LC13]OCP05175.1 ATP-dependent RNA helicase [Ensifer sp. LC14]OCP14528.1 ATP-dependent RNA helicase [Ensifer sp. LC11]OCP29188.1 ATP-dependent RNA helicase [Ensifer sp. LC499]
MTEFEGIAPAIAEALAKRGYNELTPVQKAMRDPELAGKDALVSAQTGSGKTVAFGLALAPTLLGDERRFSAAGAPLALAIAPTRELALQVKRELEWLYGETGATIASCVGGMDMRTEKRALERGAHIVVGTPGRLCDHIRRNSLDISSLRAIVLDEADEMLDLGFREDLEFILEESPDDRRTLMFSATVPKSIATLAKNYQRDAVRISTASEQKQHVDIEYRALTVAPNDRENAIINVLRYYEAKNAIVFCSTRAAVNHLTARFNNRGFSVVALSGELSQNERTHALQAMRDGRARVCIATDVAARGIDLPGLELVIHADLPTNSETLLHRSGRTGRAGQKGVSALIVPVNQRRKAERLLDGGRITANWARPPSADDVSQRDDERLLADTSFAEPIREDEQAIVAALIERHGAEQMAAAFVRQFRSGRSAPEDLIEVAVGDSRGKPRRDERSAPREDFGVERADFSDGSWFSLSVGRKQSAEPRWLIPMLCRHGKLTKRDIGAIRMQQEETFIEMTAEGAERFLSAIGKDKMLEKGIRVKPLAGAPDLSQQRQEKPVYSKDKPNFSKDKPGFAKKRSYSDDAVRSDDRGDFKPKRKFDKKPAYSEGPAYTEDRPPAKGADKPWNKKKGKPDAGKDGGFKPKTKPKGNAKNRQG